MDRNHAAEVHRHLLDAAAALDRTTQAMFKLDKAERQTWADMLFEVHSAVHFGLLRALSFRVTVNTDNRLMSGVTLSSEFAALSEAFGYGLSDVQWLTINAMKSAFAPFDERLALINTVIKPGFASAMAPPVTTRPVVGIQRP